MGEKRRKCKEHKKRKRQTDNVHNFDPLIREHDIKIAYF